MITQEQEQYIIKEYLNGKNQKTIRKFLKIRQQAVHDILIKNNIKIRDKGDGEPSNRIKFNINYFQNIDSSEKSYFLGLICADGCLLKRGRSESYSGLLLGLKDIDILKSFAKAIEFNGNIRERHRFDKRTGKTYVGYELNIYSKYFVNNIVKLGITNEKSSFVQFPPIKKEYYSHFLRGLFDGDGCFTGNKNDIKCRLQIISTPELLEFITDNIFSKLGINSFNKTIVCQKKGFNVIKLHITRQKFCKLFLDYIYQNSDKETRLERKFNLYQNYLKTYKTKWETHGQKLKP